MVRGGSFSTCDHSIGRVKKPLSLSVAPFYEEINGIYNESSQPFNSVKALPYCHLSVIRF